MKSLAQYFSLVSLVILFSTACGDDNDRALKGEVWPKSGYLFTKDDENDTVYVESGTIVMTRNFSPEHPIDDNTKKWTISKPTKGKGVVIYNDQNEYWSIDSAFHPGLMVEQHFISTVTITDKSKISNYNRFNYHKGDGNSFYIESVKFPDFYVHAIGHAESGRGLRLRNQESGTWAFWVDND